MPLPPSDANANTFGRLKPGLEVSHYRLTEYLGSGAMGAVFKAVDLVLEREVAIKFIFTGDRQVRSARAHEALRQRFIREARLMARVNHPGVVQIHEADFDAPEPYLVMELIAGQTLDERVDARPPLTTLEICEIGLQAAEALGSAWTQHQLIHRDLKPGNMMLFEGHHLKILDLGLAKALSDEAESANLTLTGMVMGTPWYMSPEQHITAKGLNQTCDIFALGTILFQLFTGKLPALAVNDYEIYLAKKDGPSDLLRSAGRGLPTHLVDTIYAMLAPDVANRLQDYDAIIAALQDGIDVLRRDRLARQAWASDPSRTMVMAESVPASPAAERPRVVATPVARPVAVARPVTPPVAAPAQSLRAVEPGNVKPGPTLVRRGPVVPGGPASPPLRPRYYMEPQEIADDLVPGDHVGEWTIDRLIGVGGIGAVYRAHDGEQREVALKVLVNSPADENTDRQRDVEALRQSLRRLQHKAIVPVRSIGEDYGVNYLVLDLFLGPLGKPVNLIDYCREFGTPDALADEAEFIPIFDHLLRALDHAHQQDMVHGGLKPQNILLHYLGMKTGHWQAELKITDFGTSRLVGEDVVLHNASQSLAFAASGLRLDVSQAAILCTYDYMSPEQRRGGRATPASDVYATGLIALRLLTGHNELPERARPSELRPGIRPEWDELIAGALRPDPAQRLPNAAALLAILRRMP